MDLNDVELMESLPTGIIVDSSIKILDKFGYSFALSGLDFETCCTFDCVKEVVRFSPIKVIIAEMKFVGGTIADLISLSKSSEKYFSVILWSEDRVDVTKDALNQVGISDMVLKSQPFEKMLKKVRDSIIRK